MTSTPIAPVVPSKLPAAAGRRSRGRGEPRGHRPLPVAVLASRPSPAAVYRVAAVDRCGRVAERSAGPGPARDLGVGQPLGGQQHDPRPRRQPRPSGRRPGQRLQAGSITLTKGQRCSNRHASLSAPHTVNRLTTRDTSVAATPVPPRANDQIVCQDRACTRAVPDLRHERAVVYRHLDLCG